MVRPYRMILMDAAEAGGGRPLLVIVPAAASSQTVMLEERTNVLLYWVLAMDVSAFLSELH